MTARRRATWRMGPADGWHDDLVWYAAAIGAMKALTPRLDEAQQLAMAWWPVRRDAAGRLTPPPPELLAIVRTWSDPLSLGYQSQVHGTLVRANDWPTHRGQRALWNECAHAHWFFLPWHRAYLVEFENVCRHHIAALAGPADTWALPYWNYSDFQRNRVRLGLPLPVRAPTLPDDVEVPGVTPDATGERRNPLFDPTREMTGDPAADDNGAWAYAGRTLQRPHFATQRDTAQVSFGGGVIEQPNVPALFHGGADEIGLLDAWPHGTVHVQVGGAMAEFFTAALDPLFWLHHCNVDRLWEIYAKTLRHGYPFDDPVDPPGPAKDSWFGHRFRFLRPDGSTGEWTSSGVVDIKALGYRYDRLTAPRLPPPPPAQPGENESPFGLDELPPPQPVAEAFDVQLLPATELALTGADLVAGDVAATRWLLRFAGVRAGVPAPTSFEVFLDAAGSGGDSVGLLTLFGAFEATHDPNLPGNGVSRLLDVTARMIELGASTALNGLTVRLVAINPDRDVAGADLTVERVTLEFG